MRFPAFADIGREAAEIEPVLSKVDRIRVWSATLNQRRTASTIDDQSSSLQVAIATGLADCGERVLARPRKNKGSASSRRGKKHFSWESGPRLHQKTVFQAKLSPVSLGKTFCGRVWVRSRLEKHFSDEFGFRLGWEKHLAAEPEPILDREKILWPRLSPFSAGR